MISNIDASGPRELPGIKSTQENVGQQRVKKVAIDALSLRTLDKDLTKAIKRIESRGKLDLEGKEIHEALKTIQKLLLCLSESKHHKDVKKIIYQLLQNLPTKDELTVINEILNNLGKKHADKLLEILKGAHVRINDDGELYDKWSNLESAHERISSHPSIKDTKQYGIMGPWMHEVLFGCVMEKGHKKTFFQLENTPWAKGITNRVGHGIDATIYFFSQSNIGPYGNSKHTDKNPIRFHKI